MPHLIGPEFIGIKAIELDASRSFYTDSVGLTFSAFGTPGAVVFGTRPIASAVRSVIVDLDAVESLGPGDALWFAWDDADALHAYLIELDEAIDFAPKDGPFGRYFAFRDPFGCTITAHTVQAG